MAGASSRCTSPWKMSPQAAVLLFVLLTHGVLGSSDQCVNMTDFSARLDTLLAEYDRETPPSSPLEVEVTLELRHASIDEHTSTAYLLGDLRMSWDDSRVTWNVSEWECDTALVSAERLWLPDLSLLNAAASSGEAALRARLNAAGRIVWHIRLDVATPVDMQLENWPYDVQTVTFKFASKEHSISTMDLQLSEDKFTIVFEAGAWDLLSVMGSREEWERAGSQRRLVSWTVGLRRRAGGKARAAAAVLAASVLMLTSAALLPPAQRAHLAAAASLTASFWLVSCAMRLPSSRSSPLVVRVASALCCCGAATAVAAALVLRLAGLVAPPPRLLCTLLSNVSALCRLTPHQESGMEVSDAPNGSGAWRAAALLLDRALLAALGVALVVLVACSAAVLA